MARNDLHMSRDTHRGKYVKAVSSKIQVRPFLRHYSVIRWSSGSFRVKSSFGPRRNLSLRLLVLEA